MNDSKQPIILQEECVIDLPEKDSGIVSDRTFRVDYLLEMMVNRLYGKTQWIDEGFECQMLAPGGIWQKGRIKLRIEFSPEEIDALFDARQEIEAYEND